MAPTVYFASPIDQADPAMVELVEAFRQYLIEAGAAVFSPNTAWAVNPVTLTSPEYVESVNGKALELAQVVVAALYPGWRSFGVPAEIDRAARMGKVVAVVNVSPQLMTPGVSLSALVNLFDGVSYFDSVADFDSWWKK